MVPPNNVRKMESLLKTAFRKLSFFSYLCRPQNRDISSVGLERCLDRAEVTGSNPVCPTSSRKSMPKGMDFFIPDNRKACFIDWEG